ncbi:MAG: hypothetical protein ACTTKL_07545 [Treponema sp.]
MSYAKLEIHPYSNLLKIRTGLSNEIALGNLGRTEKQVTVYSTVSSVRMYTVTGVTPYYAGGRGVSHYEAVLE